ncbi:hypothetical protein ASPVEDRAFT_36123 [Aspergillus versicolor CBS 583.65]|uniref:Uncharacterized protein n=1 Tax=Aspergillus versicolor CBS 583.65 TaxID=1036611 RepID=A0A1L9P5E0_ASPVE|nr:uncharacterized protein ASPVEDRAFT_36123 [Aspergillus versicolor CBS 583.65]OJI96718.1 hypothetical protein ASPVEDRAFT_36123 [Aspergillus versicolor CBS 583.65]
MTSCTDDDASCEKPTSHAIIYGVPAVISVVFLIAFIIACYIFVRRYRQRERAEDERMEQLRELRAFKRVDEHGTWAERREHGLPPVYSPGGRGRGRDSRDDF